MRYTVGLRDDGWLVVDTATSCIARFAGCDLHRLSREEARVMADLLCDIDRATRAAEERAAA